MPAEKSVKVEARTVASKAAAAHLEDDIERLRGDVSKLTQSIANLGAAKMDQYRASAANAADEISKQAWDSLESAKAELAKIERQLVRQVEVNPLKAVAVAAAAGFLAALLFRR